MTDRMYKAAGESFEKKAALERRDPLPGKAACFTGMNEDLERKERRILEEKVENKADRRTSGSNAWVFRPF